MFEKIVLSFVVLILIAFISAGCIQDVVTPAYIDPAVLEFVDINEPVNMVYTSLYDAKRLQRKVSQKLEVVDLIGKHRYEDLAISIANATELKESIFNPGSPIGMLFPALTGLGIGWLGISKPSDKKKLNGNTVKA